MSTATAVPTDAAPPPGEPGGRERGTERGAGWLLGAVIVAVVLVAGISAIGRGWLPVGDSATIEMLVRDVGGPDTTLVGFNSRFTWNHPGPWTFWLLSIPYNLGGEDPTWMLLGAGVVNAAAAAGFAWVAFRKGGLALLAWAGFLYVVLVSAIGYETLRDPWNPWIAVLPFALFVLAVWAVVDGDLPVMPVAFLAGSYALNNHSGYLGLSLTISAWMLAWVIGNAWWKRRTDRDGWSEYRRRLFVWLGISAAVVLVFWAPVLYEQLIAHSPGNITRMYDFFTTDDAPKATAGDALRIFGSEVGLQAPWLGWHEPADRFAEYLPRGAWTGLITVAVFIATGLWAWRRRAWDAVRLHLTTAFVCLMGLVSLWQLRGTQYRYLFRWTWVMGMFLVLASGWAIVRSLQEEPRRRVTRVGVPVLAAGTAVVAVLTMVLQWSQPLPLQVFEKQARDLIEPTVEAMKGDREKVFVTPAGFGLVVPYGAIVAALEAEGVDIRVPNKFFIAYGRHRALAEGEKATQVLTVAETDHEIDKLKADPNQRLIAEYIPSREEVRRDRIAHIAIFLSDQDVVGQPPPVPWGE